MSTVSNGAKTVDVCTRLTRAISRTERLPEIFDAALDALAAGLGARRAAVLLFDPDGVMRFASWRGISERYRQAVEGHSPWSMHASSAETIAVRDVAAEPTLSAHLETLRAEGIASMLFIPLEGTTGVIGKFMVCYAEPHEPSPEELQLGRLIAAQIAFGVERALVHDTARASEARLRLALDAARMGTFEWDLETDAVQWSDNVERIHGLEPGTLDATFDSYERQIERQDRERVQASIRRTLFEGVPLDVEYCVRAADGSPVWIEAKGLVHHKPDGQPARLIIVCINITSAREAARAREEAAADSHRSSQRLAAIVESSDDAIVSKDLDGIIMSWNRGAERLFGYTAEETLGQSIRLIVPSDRMAEEDHVLASIRAGRAVEMETVRRRKDGSTVDISLKVSSVRDAEGRIVGASKIARDIGPRLRQEVERSELGRRLTLLVTASASLLNVPEAESVRSATLTLAKQLLVADGYAIWLAEADGTWRVATYEGMSESFAHRVLAAEDLPASPSLSLEPIVISDVASSPIVERHRAAYRDEGIRSLLVCPMRFDIERIGTLVFYYRVLHGFSEMDVQTAQALANLAAAAITTADLYSGQQEQRRAAEAANRRATFMAEATAILSRSLDYEHTLAAVARLAVPEIADWCAVDIMNPSGRLQRLAVAHVDPAKVEFARSLEQKYPVNPESAGGVYEVVRTGKPQIMASIPQDLLAAAASRDEEVGRILEELALSSYLCVPLISASGSIGAMTFVFAESGRHYTEHDLAFAADVAARAALAIDNALAYRRAHDANRLKDDFLATLSHELRTPLNAILGYGQMLNMGILNGERQSQAISVLTRNAESLRQIIDDVLDVSRITSGKLRLNVRPLAMDEILRNAVGSLQPAADAKGVSIQPLIDPQVPVIAGDADRLQQVVWNLLSNAVKFTARGGHIQLRLSRVESSIQITVSDDGQGIDPSFLPYIFERFRQADSRFAREQGGLGLGLAIVRELVALHGGKVSAHSDGVGTGATFKVSLPPMIVHSGVIGAAEAVQSTLTTGVTDPLGRQLEGARILAVDDQDDALVLIQRILETAGAKVTTAASGPRALELLRNGAYDALVADIGMPRMDGLELIRSVRRLQAPANRVPAAALTAYARAEDRVTALAMGFQMHIAKPVDPAELVVAVAALLGRSV